MAYDPYYTGQDAYSGYDGGYGYDQSGYGYDQSGYGYDQSGYGYDPYGYGSYDQYYAAAPLPPPDKNWEDPAKLNREYLRSIKKPVVQEGFEGLKEDSLYLLEVTTRSVTLKKTVVEDLLSADASKKSIEPVIQVKFFDFPFLDLVDVINREYDDDTDIKPSTVAREEMSFRNLFQDIFTSPGERNDILSVNEEGQQDKTSSIISKTSGHGNGDITEAEKPIEEMESFDIMKGKSALIPTTGLQMIQNLQQHPLIVKVAYSNSSEEDKIVEVEHLGTSSIRLPEALRQGVLLSCKPEASLPVVVARTTTHPLTDVNHDHVGSVELTIAMTCLGKAIANCVVGTRYGFEYDSTYLLKNPKAKDSIDQDIAKAVHPRLARDILRLGLFYPSGDSSSHVLQECVVNNRIVIGSEEERHARGTSDCEWFRMVQKCRPPPPVDSFDAEKELQTLQKERAALWTKVRNVCRGYEMKESPWKTDLDDRFAEVQIPGRDDAVESSSKSSVPNSRLGTETLTSTKLSKDNEDKLSKGEIDNIVPIPDKPSTQTSVRKPSSKPKKKPSMKPNKQRASH